MEGLTSCTSGKECAALYLWFLTTVKDALTESVKQTFIRLVRHRLTTELMRLESYQIGEIDI
jgi:hypothetical protein